MATQLMISLTTLSGILLMDTTCTPTATATLTQTANCLYTTAMTTSNRDGNDCPNTNNNSGDCTYFNVSNYTHGNDEDDDVCVEEKVTNDDVLVAAGHC